MKTNEKIKVLLVDDDEDDFIITEAFFEEDPAHRFVLDWVSDPVEGINKIKSEAYDVYLIDLFLGEPNGLEIIEQAVAFDCKKPLILLTGLGNRDIDKQALETGAADYLVKGQFNADMLHRSVLYAMRHRQTLNELSLSEARYRAVIDIQTELISRYQPDGTLTFVNDAFAKYFGTTTHALIGENLLALLPEKKHQGFLNRIKTMLADQTPNKFENRVDRVGFEPRWQIWTEQPILNDEGEVFEIQAVGVDITNRKKSEIVLKQALERERELGELKSRFVTMASHEFRTPLTTIMSTASYLELAEKKISTEKRLSRLGKIRQAATNMTQLLEDVLLFGKADAGRILYEPDFLNIPNFLTELIEDIQAGDKQSHVIEFTNDMTVDQVFVDEKLLRQITTNLITNAIKYSPTGSTICVQIENNEQMFFLNVTDRGIGIPKKDQAHIFTPFHRATNVRDISGTGLGLAITQKAVEKHGGKIAFKSADGVGTTFSVEIPLMTEAV